MWKQRLRIFTAQQARHRLGACTSSSSPAPASWCPGCTPPTRRIRPSPSTPLERRAVARTTRSGTDSSGFDELGRIFYGGEYSLTLGFLAGFITIVVGTLYGMISGFVGGVTDTVMMRIIDAFLSIPYIFLLHHPDHDLRAHHGVPHLVIGLTRWWGNARIIRGDALLIRQLEYSQAATAMGGEQDGTSSAATCSRTRSATS